jgi:hypothetical protein
MTRSLLAACLILLLPALSFGQSAVPNWVKVADKAAWQPRDSQGELVYQDQLWIFGGWYNSFEAPPRDVWSSPNGKDWKLINQSAPWKHSDLSMSVTFDNKMWFMGGWYNGRLKGHSASNSVWSSTDGIQWNQTATAAGWTPRLASALVVFKGKMWLLGGIENYYFGDETSLKNDVWSSTDGKQWTRETKHAGWSPRAYHQAAVLNDRIYVFGGGNYVPMYQATNDVWSSADGVHWKQETAAAAWHPRLWFSSVVYCNRMWVLGGWSNNPSNNPSKNWGDVWHSKDGSHWRQLKTEETWKERHEHSAFVFQDKLWLAGGHARPLSNEVWSLQLPKAWSPQD